MNKIHILFAVLFLSAFPAGSGTCGELNPLFPGYPTVFSGTGQLDFIVEEENRLVIDDAGVPIQPTSTYHTPDGKAALSDFAEGDVVGIIQEKGSRKLISMWLIKAGEKQKPAAPVQDGENDIRLEDGVWKN